ncbi:MAG: hypothetical protein O2779_04755 [Nanoarchaeota archaeon]|nr:hypothetical protein [Nanoarchaeota archaeon]
MAATRVQEFILFTLGKWFEEANKKIVGKPLEVSISKTIFIGLVKKAEFARKQSRALYKNLEILEKKKLISYANKELMLTARGRKLYATIDSRVSPYVDVVSRLRERDASKYTKKVQTVFKA